MNVIFCSVFSIFLFCFLLYFVHYMNERLSNYPPDRKTRQGMLRRVSQLKNFWKTSDHMHYQYMKIPKFL
jgi:hypothetical protein